MALLTGSVKLEHILAGSPKSPVTLAHHADTNTIRSEPVHSETVPPFATQSYDQYAIDQSIIQERPPGIPDQISSEIEQMQEGSNWAQTCEKDVDESVMWSASTSHWSNTTQGDGVKWQPESSRDMNMVQWPPQPEVEASEAQPLTPMKAIVQQAPKPFIPVLTQVPQPVKWSPKMTSVLTEQLSENSMQSALKQSLSEIQSVMTQACQNFSRVESSEMSAVEKMESSNREITQSHEFRTTEEEIRKTESSRSEMMLQQESLNSSVMQETCLSESAEQSLHSNESMYHQAMAIDEVSVEKINESQSGEMVTNETQHSEINAATNHLQSQQLNAEFTQSLPTIREQAERPEQLTIPTEVSHLDVTEKENAMSEISTNIASQYLQTASSMEQMKSDYVTFREKDHVQDTVSTIDIIPETMMTDLNTSNESFKHLSEVNHTEQNIFDSEISSSSEQQIALQNQTFSSEESAMTLSNNNVFYEGHAVNGTTTKTEPMHNRDARAVFQESLAKYEKSEYRAVQESQYTESNRTSMSVMSTTDEEVQDLFEREFNQISMQYEKIDKPEIKKPAASLPGAVRILPPGCELAPATKVVALPSGRSENETIASRESFKKPYKKPASMVPGARPLFGEAIELHLEPANSGDGDNYSKIPVKNLIKTFEESTKPFLKNKSNIQYEQDMSQMSKFSSQQQSLQESTYNSHSVHDTAHISKLTSQQQSLQENQFNLQSTQDITRYAEFSSDQQSLQQNKFDVQSVRDTTQFAKITSEQQSFQESVFRQASIAEQNSRQTSLYATMPSDNIPMFQGNLTESDVRQLYFTNLISNTNRTVNGMLRNPQLCKRMHTEIYKKKYSAIKNK